MSEVTVSAAVKATVKEPVDPELMSLAAPPLDNDAAAPHEPDHPAGAVTDEQVQPAGMAISTSLMPHPPPLCTVHVIEGFAWALGTTDGATVTE